MKEDEAGEVGSPGHAEELGFFFPSQMRKWGGLGWALFFPRGPRPGRAERPSVRGHPVAGALGL